MLLFGLLFLGACQQIANQPATQTNEANITQEQLTTNILKSISVRQPKVSKSYRFSSMIAGSIEQSNPVIYNDLWHKTIDHFSLPDQHHPRVKPHRQWYLNNTAYMQRVASRAKRYYHHILQQVLEADVPGEIALLPIVESGFNTFGYSSRHASGPWQFIPSTGKLFGLKQDWWYDGRRDILASTDAALAYLIQLNQRFDGDWLLAIAAYNSGPGNVSKAIKKNKKKGLSTDFWSLSLPKETMHYVPKLLGLSQAVRQTLGTPALPAIPNKPYFQQVDVGSQIDLGQAAAMADISIEEMHLLNSGFNQHITSPDGPFKLLVPANHASKLRQELAQLPKDKRITWQRYKVESGDNLLYLSQVFSIPVTMIKSFNNMTTDTIYIGDNLFIPTMSDSYVQYTQNNGKRIIENVSRQLKSPWVYQVNSGDSLWSIANKNRISVAEIVRWNQLDINKPLQIKQKLKLWPASQNKRSQALIMATSPKSGQANNSRIRKLNYKVRKGDNLWLIAQRFNVQVSDIRSWNKHSNEYLYPGENLVLFVDVTKTNS